LERFVTTHDEK